MHEMCDNVLKQGAYAGPGLRRRLIITQVGGLRRAYAGGLRRSVSPIINYSNGGENR